jgi:hypothetical protein
MKEELNFAQNQSFILMNQVNKNKYSLKLLNSLT